MMDNIERDKILKKSKHIIELGLVKTHRKGDTGIGKTFEDLMGVSENNLPGCDLHGYEIKSQRINSASYITLFTKSPTHPRGINAILRDKFGTPYDDNPSLKRLHTSMFANSYNTYKGEYSFKLIHEPLEEKIYIGVFKNTNKELLDKTAYYTYKEFQKIFDTKLKRLFLVLAESIKIDKIEHFKYKDIYLYYNPSISEFLKLIDQGLIMYDIRIGVYRSGKNIGKSHDHGSGFRIKRENIHKLYKNFIKA